MASKRIYGAICGAVVLVSSVGLGRADAMPLTVDCAAGETIARALDRQEPGNPLVLRIMGTCNENVTITRDEVTLQGGADGATLRAADATRAAIVVEAAQRVVIERLAVTQGQHGIVGVRGANLTVRDSRVSFTDGDAILLDRGSHAVIQRSVIETKSAPQIHVSASTAKLMDNTLRGKSGVRITRGGSAQVGTRMVLTSTGLVECPTLRAQLASRLKNRTDGVAAEVKTIADEASVLHETGDHLNSVALYHDAARVLGIALAGLEDEPAGLDDAAGTESR